MLTLCKACLRDFEGLPGWIQTLEDSCYLFFSFFFFFVKSEWRDFSSGKKQTRESLVENIEESDFGELGRYNCEHTLFKSFDACFLSQKSLYVLGSRFFYSLDHALQGGVFLVPSTLSKKT